MNDSCRREAEVFIVLLDAGDIELNSDLNGSPPVGRRLMPTLIAITVNRPADARFPLLVLRAPTPRG
jgi:hypothetical protein